MQGAQMGVLPLKTQGVLTTGRSVSLLTGASKPKLQILLGSCHNRVEAFFFQTTRNFAQSQNLFVDSTNY